MQFSVITPTPGREREASYQLSEGAYGDHQWMWRFFPAEAGSVRDHLFRRDDRGTAMRFYVVSHREPIAFSDAWTVQTRPYQPRLTTGDELEFDLRANPVITRAKEGKHARHDVVMHAKRIAKEGTGALASLALIRSACTNWLHVQGNKHGFEFDSDELSVEGYAQHVGKQNRLRFSTVDFRGRLRVTQPEVFTVMLMKGLGHAKAFGCGLMLVRRPL